MTTFSSFAALSSEELAQRITKAKTELLELTMAVRMRQEKNTAKKRAKRKEVARLSTAQRQKNIVLPSSSSSQ